MVTESGLIRFNSHPGNQNGDKNILYTKFLPHNEIFPYEIYRQSDGKIFVGAAMGSGKGYFCFYPTNIIENINIPPIVVTDFKIHNESLFPDTNIALKKHLYLKHNQNFFTIETAVLDYLDPPRNQYAYYLEGFENDWIYKGNNRIANYTNVPPGEYIFHVKGSNTGYWNETGAALRITIVPPPWKTWWAYLLYTIGILLILFIIIRFYLKRLALLHKLEMEKVEKTKIKELDSMKSRFFANISHEFRTPLTLILGPLEKVMENASGSAKKNLAIMQRNALHLQKLINELLNLSKIESGQMKIRAEKIDLVKAVTGYAHSFESLARQRKINLVIGNGEKGILVYADREKLEKILFNLLSNAFKFTPAGGKIVVSVGSGQSAAGSNWGNNNIDNTADHPGGYVEIKVSDTGKGINRDTLSHIFERFYQAEDKAPYGQPGTGIGLALTKELVEMHHGKITVESEIGKGSTFRVILPLGRNHLTDEEIFDGLELPDSGQEMVPGVISEDEVKPFEQGPGYSASDKEKPILLIVEDNSDLREYIRDSLKPSFNIVEANDGSKGLKVAVNKIPDLILSDVMMPGMDGFELCKKLKTDERTSHIPIILLTAKAGIESKIEGLETGADDYLTKPFDARELLVRINNLLVSRKKLREKFLRDTEKSGLTSVMDHPETNIPSVEQKFLRKAIDVLDVNFPDPDFTVKRFCSEMAMSNMQLHRKLVALTGQTANRLIRSYRLNRAARLLDNNAGTVTEVAYMVGFNNLSWFAKCFQEQYGTNPSRYADKHKHL